MNLLLENIQRLIRTQEDIDKIKQVILNLAVRGKLVEQRSQDDSVESMLVKIQQEREQLLREKIIKDKKQPEPISPDEIPYQIPQGWKWVRLSEICYNFGQKVPDSKFTYIDVSAIDKTRGVISNEYKILNPEEAPSRARKIVKKGTVIFSTVRPYLLNVAIVEADFEYEPIVSTAFAVMHPYSVIDNRYLYYYLRSRPFIEFVESNMVGVAYPAISEGQFFKGLFPLPPLGEQRRICKKIELLFNLCDHLSSKIEEREKASNILNRSAFSIISSNDKNTVYKGIDFVVKNFHHLCNTQIDINALRNSILSLAVKGFLVPQDPNDEPAAELLKRIREEKERLIKEKKIKKEKPLPPISPEEIPYELPKGWEWVRLGEIVRVISGKTINSQYEQENGDIIYLKVSDMNLPENSKEIKTSSRFVDYNTYFREEELIPAHSIIFPKRGGAIATNKKRIIIQKMYVDSNIMALSVPELINLDYIYYWFNTIDLWKLNSGTSVPQINNKDIEPILVPIPPKQEQKRIVDKINEKMDYCNKIEEQIKKLKKDNEMLMKAILQKFLCDRL